MSMDFIESLGEARMFKTRDQIGREGSRSMTDHLFVSLLSLYAMSNDYNYAPVAAGYARQTNSRGAYNNPSPSGTDLYQTLYSLKRPDELFTDEKDATLMSKVRLDDRKIKRFIDGIARGNLSSNEASTFFYKLERDLKIQSPKLRAARRLIQDWDTLNTTQQKLAATQLMQHYRLNARRSDLMPIFGSFAKDNRLEVKGEEKQSIAKKVAKGAAIAAGAFAVGYAAGKSTEF